MDITLEKIDIIRDRTGVTYKQAKEALELSNGNVVDALISIEEQGSKKWTESITVKGNEALDKLKSILNSGNVSRIRVKKDEYVILDIPVTAGALGAVIIPQITAIGAAVALLSKCVIEVERPNKELINVSNAITNAAEDVANRIKNAAEEMKSFTGRLTNKGSRQPGEEGKGMETESLIFTNDPTFNTTTDTSSQIKQ
ncbi:MAG: DUF4342 domain-containing protein [Bacillota bacterium]